MLFGAALGLFGLLSLGLFLFARRNAPADDQLKRAEFVRFQRTYLVVYGLAVAGDWLQGPHVYALYQSYWMTKHQIELLFIAGFGSSLLFGTVIGSIADKFGRRANCLLYTLLYGFGCLSKHSANFNILLIGRLMGGISTSILFSAFEAWLVHEHKKPAQQSPWTTFWQRKFSFLPTAFFTSDQASDNFYVTLALIHDFNDNSLRHIFTNATLTNSLIAILAGLVAQGAANVFGYVAPFDCALVVLALMALACWWTWTENYGDENARVEQSFVHSLVAIRDDRRILHLGLVQSLFEGSMYVFVLQWTPALSNAAHTNQIPHGYIFASFMLAIMAGSTLFNMFCQWLQPENFMRYVLLLSALSLCTPIAYPEQPYIIFASFTIFELCVGIFWPAMGFLRSKYIPEETRATTMNFFRVPLNLLVIGLLYQNLVIDTIFMFCVFFLLLAAFIQHGIYNMTCKHPHNQLPSYSCSKDEQDKLLEDIAEAVEKSVKGSKTDDGDFDEQQKKQRQVG